MAALGVQPHEWPRVIGFSAAFMLLSIGVEFGRIGRDSYFLTEAGVEAIPLMYVLIAVLMVASAPLYDRLVHRIAPDRLLIIMQATGGAAALLVWLEIVLDDNPSRVVPYLLFPGVESFLLYFLMHFWKFAHVSFHALEGKRLFPLIGGTGLFGSLVGGIASRLMSGAVGADSLFLLWAGLLFATIPLTRLLRERVRDALGEPPHAIEATSPSVLAVMRQPLLRTLAYMAVPMWIIIYIIEYTYFDVANRAFPDQDALAAFLGTIVSAGAAIGLILQFTVTPALLRRGVGSTAMVYPTTLTVGALLLLLFSLFPSSTAASLPIIGIAMFVVFARLCDVAVFFSVHDSAQQLLFYAVPAALRDRARVLTSGVFVPASMGVAGGLLILFTRWGEPGHNLAFVSIVLAFLMMVIGMSLTPEYLQALLTHLHPDDVEHRREILTEIGKLEDNDARYVLLQSLDTDDLEQARFAVERLFTIKDQELIPDILESASRIRVEVLREIEQRMDDEERHVHAALLQHALQVARGPQ